MAVSLHAGTVCEVYQRSRLERLRRYINRPPVATKRLSVDRQSRIVYQYKQPFRHLTIPPILLGLHDLPIGCLGSVYGLLLIASKLLMADIARLRTYIRPHELAYVDAGP